MLFVKKTFYDSVRSSLFNGSISDEQFDGLSRIMRYWQISGLTDLRWLAYMYATVYHETAYTMQPIQEYGSTSYLQSKPYYPWYGRGLVQLTWEDNYIRMGGLCNADYTTDPNVVLEWPHSLAIMFEGMTHGVSKTGDFTGKSLEDYFNLEHDDPKGARAIINGTDCADEIAGHHKKFLTALESSHVETSALEEKLRGLIKQYFADGGKTWEA